MRVASLDLGSNTFLLLIVDLNENGPIKIDRVVCDLAEVTRLAQGVNESKILSPEALLRARKCFEKYRSMINSAGVDKVVAVATSAARDAKNSDEFFALAEKFSLPVKIISGQREAELTYAGSTFDIDGLSGIPVIDVGGGSTEIIGLSDKVIIGQSLNIGSVRLMEKFVKNHPTSWREIQELDTFIEKEVSANLMNLPKAKNGGVLAVAGTPTTLAAIDQRISFSQEGVHGYQLDINSIKQWRDRLANMPLSERLELNGMQPGREDVIVVGASILFKVAELIGAEKVFVSTKGVRYGLALQYKLF